MSGPAPLSPEQLALLPHDDRGPALYGVSWGLTALASTLLGLRVYCKLLGHRALWWDDWILIASWVLLVIDTSLVTSMVLDYGFGKHSWDFHPPSLDRFVLIADVRTSFTVTAIVWTKTAFALTLLRLTEGWTKRFIYLVIVSMNIAMGLSALLLWVQCKPLAKAWTPSMEGTCWDPQVITDINIFSSAYSAAMDFLLALLPWKLIWTLRMKKAEKVGLAIALSMGIFAGVTAIVKTVKLPKLASGDLYDAADLVQWDITETAVTMMAACIPVLRILIRDVRASTRARYTLSEGGGGRSRTTTSGRSAAAQIRSGGGSRGTINNNNKHNVSRMSGYTSTFLKLDDQSDKSILDAPGPVASPTQPGHIKKTEEVSVEFRDRHPGEAGAYEMDDFSGLRPPGATKRR